MNLWFTSVMAVFGGVLIGLAALAFFALEGRTAGASGLLADVVAGGRDSRWVSAAFLLGLVAVGITCGLAAPERFGATPLSAEPGLAGTGLLVGAGLLVGVGTRLSRGCTGGHGVCGIGFLSPRSLVATLTFMATGGLGVLVTSWILAHVGGAR